MPPSPRDVLASDHQEALTFVRKSALDHVQGVLRRAAAELEDRLRNMPADGQDTFTAVRMRTTLMQIRHVITRIQSGMRDALLNSGDAAARAAAHNIANYLRTADEEFRGVGDSPLAIEEASLVDAATSGVRSSILSTIAHDPQHVGKPGVLTRYGLVTIGDFERTLQKSFIARTPWEMVKKQLIESSPFLQGAPAHWAERIVRTESMGVYNRAGWHAVQQADVDLGDMVKILSATFDDRTASDSYAVHGQIRRPMEAFQSWFGLYQHPPNRPNDREVVVPHRMAWPIPPYLAWKSDEQVLARWKAEGRKAEVPPRPKMTTVPMSEFGPKKEAPAPTPTPTPIKTETPKRDIPKERFAINEPPPVPKYRLKERKQFEIPDLTAQRTKVATFVKKDEEIFGPVWAGDPLDDPKYKLVILAEKKFKSKGRSKDSKSYTLLPEQFAKAVPDFSFDPQQLMFNANIGRNEIGYEQRQAAIRAAATEERVAVEDFAMANREMDIASRWAMKRNISELVDNRGSYLPENEDKDLAGPPILLRIGEKLYPYNGASVERVAAASFLKMKTVNARVIDLTEQHAKEIREHNVAVEEQNRKTIETSDPKYRERQEMRDAELARIQAATEARVRAEYEGDPEVVAVRMKHQPADYAKQYEEKYHEAAASLGWGKAMEQRGLDMPLSRLREVAKRFDEDPGHPLNFMHFLLTENMEGNDAKTLREFIEKEEATEKTYWNRKGDESIKPATTIEKDRNAMRVAGTVLAHIDAIKPYEKIGLGNHPMDVRDARTRTEEQLKNLAGLIDQSVTLPWVDVTKAVPRGGEGKARAACDVKEIANWGRRRRAELQLKPDESTWVVFHETGHAIEASDRRRGVRASAFLDARTAGDPKIKLNSINRNYQADEEARPDAFRDPYVGADYGRELEGADYFGRSVYFGEKKQMGKVEETKRVHRGTEVTSMAIQNLADDWHTALDSNHDPEHFLFGLGQLGGF
jgi:hypothetical protein